ncbi:MAG: AAA family ATPase [Thermoleophilia bacterium]
MSELRINTLRLRNFKGIRDFTLNVGGRNADIFADNARGKTTLKDAFLWLLFDKDSANRKDFEIKTLDEKGEALHGLEHEVEGDFGNVSLRKVYTEKWTKKRGSANRTFEGHTTDYYIDGVPVKLSEYKAKVTGICDESVFRLLTDPSYFSQVMKWQDRRQLLLEVCGDITDADVIASDGALAQLPEILGSRSLEDHRKVIAAKRSEINKELERIPVRIDEVTQGLPEVSGDATAIESDLKKFRAQAQEKHQEKARLEAGGEVAEKRQQLAEARAELQTIENAARVKADEANRAARQAAGDLTFQIDKLTRQIGEHERTIGNNQNTIRRLEADMDKLREKWTAIDAEILTDTTETVCPACEQDLPADRVQAAREKAQARFNTNKAERLERNQAEGKQAKAEAGELSLENERLREEIKMLETKREALEQQKANAPAPADVTDPTDGAGEQLLGEIAALEAEIEQLGDGNTDALTLITDAISELQAQIREKESALAAFAQQAQGKERIKELTAQEKKLAAEFEQLESELFLTEQFIRAKVGLLEEKINSRFEIARFKLFEEQINGALNEVCELTVNGVPYSDLNNGARINAGLDVIKTLSAHYGFMAPVIIDNAEAVTKLIDMDAQIIRLVVSAADKELRIETETNLKEAVNG